MLHRAKLTDSNDCVSCSAIGRTISGNARRTPVSMIPVDFARQLFALHVATAILLQPATVSAGSRSFDEDGRTGAARVALLVPPSATAEDRAQVGVVSEGHSWVLSVRGGTGIGRATLHRLGEQWPRELILRLHLQGLETLRMSNGNRTIRWSIASTGIVRANMMMSLAGTSTVVDFVGADYTPVRLVGDNLRIPLLDGYFELVLPSFLFEGSPPTVSLHWIDFYR
jgi:hypothetical protein